MIRLIDSHAHLQLPQFAADLEDVIQRARDCGVGRILNVGVDLPTSQAAVDLAERYDLVCAGIGVHPHDASALTPGVLAELKALAAHPNVVAIGEIGLDYYRDLSPRAVQREAFARQLDLALELHLPVVVHCREAVVDVLSILDGWRGVGVLHSYSGGLDHLEEALALGFCIGISGPVTYPRSAGLRAVAAAVPVERLLTETDCPYLAPEPHRGRRNEPAHVRYVLDAVAQARSMSSEVLADQIAANMGRLFGVV
jgi:TatD DNase family protein